MKLTPIFPPHIKPVRKGVYKTALALAQKSKPRHYSYWNGKKWGFFCVSAEEAYEDKFVISDVQNKRWQGVLK